MKKLLICIIGLIIFCSIVTTVWAITKSDKIEAKLTGTTQTLKAGEKITITLKFDKYNQIVKGINAFKARLEYDENIFEKVAQADFTTENDWEELKYNEENEEFVAIKKAGSKKEENILQLNLKVKKEVEPAKTEVRIEQIVTSEGKEDLFLEDAIIELDIIKDQTSVDDPDAISSDKYRIENGYVERILPETTVAEFRKNVTTKQNIIFTNEKGENLKETDIVKTGTKIKVGSTLNYTLIVIGDTDKDGKLTINDLAQAKQHIIGYKLLEGIRLKAANVDDDKLGVTINDISQMKLILINKLKLK